MHGAAIKKPASAPLLTRIRVSTSAPQFNGERKEHGGVDCIALLLKVTLSHFAVAEETRSPVDFILGGKLDLGIGVGELEPAADGRQLHHGVQTARVGESPYAVLAGIESIDVGVVL
jgi:hypothetical protein